MHINNKDSHYLSGTTSLMYQEHALHLLKCVSQQVRHICNSDNANTQTVVATADTETGRLRHAFLRVSGPLSSANIEIWLRMEDETDEKWETPPPAPARQICVCVHFLSQPPLVMPKRWYCPFTHIGALLIILKSLEMSMCQTFTFSSICCRLLKLANKLW